MPASDQRVVVVTGGGGGIGAAVAEELGRRGDFVVTMDPLVSIDGTEVLPPAEETTAGRIEAAGGSARATSVSVTDADGVRRLFDGLVEERGRLDAIVNVAGITRPTSFTRGSDEDWRAVLEVHLDGYLNVLSAALPIMAAVGRGQILGVTSGSGWRAADTGAYGCAKRAVAALTWQLGPRAPDGVAVNAMSPIAVTRMVTAALSRAPAASAGSTAATGGLSLGSMPEPQALGPTGAHLVGDGIGWCRGQVVFAGGPEVAVVEPPRLLEVVRTDGAVSLTRVLDAVLPAFVTAEERQSSGGGSNPRFGALFEEAASAASAGGRRCGLAVESPGLAAALKGALGARGVEAEMITPAAEPASALAAAGALDAVVVALGGATTRTASGWQGLLAEHEGIVGGIYADARWTRAVADYAKASDRPVRLVSLTDAVSAGGRSRAQAAAQLARSSHQATKERVAAFSVSVEASGTDEPAAALAAHLVTDDGALGLSGAELVVGHRWLGLRSHPRPSGTITFGGPEVPDWFDDALRQFIGGMP